MASVVDWPPQLAGAASALAGWPGSNGSMMLMNGGAAEAELADPVAAGPVEVPAHSQSS